MSRENLVERLAMQIGNRRDPERKGINFLEPDQRELWPDIAAFINECSPSPSFEFINVEGELGSALRDFAGKDHWFNAPNKTRWKPDMSNALAAPDTATGWIETLTEICAHYPRTIVIIVNEASVDPVFLQQFRNVTLDVRLVILK